MMRQILQVPREQGRRTSVKSYFVMLSYLFAFIAQNLLVNRFDLAMCFDALFNSEVMTFDLAS